jgi:hypothetical protein
MRSTYHLSILVISLLMGWAIGAAAQVLPTPTAMPRLLVTARLTRVNGHSAVACAVKDSSGRAVPSQKVSVQKAGAMTGPLANWMSKKTAANGQSIFPYAQPTYTWYVRCAAADSVSPIKTIKGKRPRPSPTATPNTIATAATPRPTVTSVTFVRSDTSTQGNWMSSYGALGYSVVGGRTSLSSAASFVTSGQSNWTWSASTTDPRAPLVSSAAGAGRTAGCWYSPTSFTVDVNLTDGVTHQMQLYALDWDNQGRIERVDVVDPANGSVLSSRTVSSFTSGQYLVYNVTGHVQFRITNVAGPNAVLSGVFFGGWPPHPIPTATPTATRAPTPTPTPTPDTIPPDDPTKNLMGLNLSWVNDYDPEAPYADLVKTARCCGNTAYSTVTPTFDANGWPTYSDVQMYLWSGNKNNNAPGTYQLSLNGVVTSIGPYWSSRGSQFGPLHYDPATNTTTCTFTPTNSDLGPNNFWISIFGAYRDQARTQPGLTNLKIMRPDPKTGVPFAPTVLFNTPMPEVMKKFSVVRYVHFENIELDTQVNWSDRRLPSYRDASGYPPWEHIVLLSNLTGTSPWINIPLKVTDEYVLNLAQLFAFGSDGSTGLPYTGPYGSSYNADTNQRPAPYDPSTWVEGTTSWYPPLKANLKLYVEWYDEFWNWANPWVTGYLYASALATTQDLGSPCFYDSNHTCNTAAFIAMRTAQFSLIFRSVFGDAAMMARVRPILASQATWADGPVGLNLMLGWAFNYLNNGDGAHLPNSSWVIPETTTQVQPHPLTYYWYGAGGPAYYDPSDTSSVSSLLTSGDMDLATWGKGHLSAGSGMIFPTVFGLKRIAYEGGPELDTTANSITAAMTFRPSSPNMQDIVEAHHDYWSQQGGDLLVYFCASQHRWAFLPIDAQHPEGTVNTNLVSPKLLAIDELNRRPRAAVAVGVPFGTATPGAAWATDAAGYGTSNLDMKLYFTVDGSYHLNQPGGGLRGSSKDNWVGYIFRTPTAGSSFGVSLQVSAAAAGTVIEVFFDGTSLGIQSVGNDGTYAFPIKGSVMVGPHGVIVKARSGSCNLMTVKV